MCTSFDVYLANMHGITKVRTDMSKIATFDGYKITEKINGYKKTLRRPILILFASE